MILPRPRRLSGPRPPTCSTRWASCCWPAPAAGRVCLIAQNAYAGLTDPAKTSDPAPVIITGAGSEVTTMHRRIDPTLSTHESQGQACATVLSRLGQAEENRSAPRSNDRSAQRAIVARRGRAGVFTSPCGWRVIRHPWREAETRFSTAHEPAEFSRLRASSRSCAGSLRPGPKSQHGVSRHQNRGQYSLPHSLQTRFSAR